MSKITFAFLHWHDCLDSREYSLKWGTNRIFELSRQTTSLGKLKTLDIYLLKYLLGDLGIFDVLIEFYIVSSKEDLHKKDYFTVIFLIQSS